MRRLALDGHYGARVDIDLCAPCHLLWFDDTENVRLNGAALVALIGTMGRAQSLAHHVLGPAAGCARCGAALRAVHNQSRWGRSTQMACTQRHGVYVSFAQFLADKGLTRPLASADLAAVIAREGALACVGCGADVAAGDERCRHCGALPALFDVARLARALDPEGALDAQPVHAQPARRGAHDCPACGGPVARTSDFGCSQCGATLAVARLAEAAAAVQPLAEALRKAAVAPPPHVVAKRLAEIDRNAGRQREWVAEMEAQAAQQRTASGDWGGGDQGDERPARLRRWAGAIVASVLALLWLMA